MFSLPELILQLRNVLSPSKYTFCQRQHRLPSLGEALAQMPRRDAELLRFPLRLGKLFFLLSDLLLLRRCLGKLREARVMRGAAHRAGRSLLQGAREQSRLRVQKTLFRIPVIRADPLLLRCCLPVRLLDRKSVV